MNSLDHGHDQTTQEAYHRAAVMLHEALLDETEGTFSTCIYSGARLGNEVRMMEKLISGELALANVTAANAAVYVPALSLFSAPYLFSDGTHFTRVMTDADLKQTLGDRIRACFPDLECIAYFTPGPRNIYSRTMPVASPEDVVGLRMRVMASPVEARVWASLGAVPVALPFGEIEKAMQGGQVDAAEDTAAVYSTQRHYGIGPYYALTNHQWSVAMIVSNTKLARRISADLPAALRAAGARISRRAIDYAITDDAARVDSLRRMPDVHLVEPDVAAFKAKTENLSHEIAEETGMQRALQFIADPRKSA